MTSRVLIVLLALLALAVPSAASAAGRSQIISDCEDDSRLSGTYTPGELRDARDNLPSDKEAYTDCGDVLRSAIAASARRRASQSGAGGTGDSAPGAGTTPQASAPGAGATGGGGGGGEELNSLDTAAGAARAPAASPDDFAELESIKRSLPQVEVRGQRIVPGIDGVAGQAASATVPTSLVTVLALLGVTAVLALVPLARRRVLARRAG